MGRALLAGLAAWTLFLSCPPPSWAFTLLTEDLPPFNYLHDGLPRGPGVDIVTTVLARTGTPVNPGDIRVLPWARAFHQAQGMPDALLFSTARTPEREGLFKWVGPIMRVTVGTIVRKESRMAPRQWSDLRGLRIGTVRNTVGEQLLLEKGVPQESLHSATTPADAVRMLTAGRVDVLAFNIHSTFYMMQQGGIDSAAYSVSMVLERFDLYMAFNPAADDALLARLQSTLDDLRCNGGIPGGSEIARIVRPYAAFFPPGSFPEERNCPRAETPAP